jgi:hypothetical protein
LRQSASGRSLTPTTSPVFRDMLEVGNASAIESQIPSGSSQPVGKKRKTTSDQDEDTIPKDTIPVDDDAESMRLMFNLLENQKEPVKLEDHPVARLKNLVTLADKYDLALVTRLLMQVLWDGIEKSDKSAFKVYQVAVALKLGALARYAVYRFGKTERPEKFSWAVIQELGLEAYSALTKAVARRYPPGNQEKFDWRTVEPEFMFPT